MHLRPATLDDAKTLFVWRNDIETRKNSLNEEETSWKNHLTWLTESLSGNITTRTIYIAENEGTPIGTVRADKKKEAIELSWTVAPEARGHGYGKLMVLQFVREFFPDEDLIATVEDGNLASRKIVEALGLHRTEKINLEGDPRSFWIWR